MVGVRMFLQILIVAITLILLFTSCEGYKCAEGIIVDKDTGIPLDSVLVNVKTGKKQMYTDSSGKFEVCNQMGGCVFGCRDITVEFSKPGFKTLIKFNEEGNGTIFMEK